MWEVVARHAILAPLFFLPYPRRKAVDRWLRGREEYRKLHRADWLLVSWGKSGRTWLRVMMSRVYQLQTGLPEYELLDFDNLARRHPALPKVFFTHGNYLRDYTGHGYETKVDFYGKRIVFLVRDPRDVAVSQYFQWKFRMRPHKKKLNDYPSDDSMGPFEFLMQPEQGLPRVISYFNAWIREIPNVGDVLVVRYEDMRTDPGTVLARILEFTGNPATDDQIADAVEFARFENLKKMEEKTRFSLLRSNWRLVPGDKGNPDSYKVRRAKVGGYRDYFSDEELAQIDGIVDRDLVPTLGYTGAGRAARNDGEETDGTSGPISQSGPAASREKTS